MGTAVMVILLGFLVVAGIVVLVMVRLDRSVRRRYGTATAAPPESGSRGPDRQP